MHREKSESANLCLRSEKPYLRSPSADEYRAYGDYGANRQIGRIIAGVCDVAITRGSFTIDSDCKTTHFDDPFVCRRPLKSRAGRCGNVGRRVIRCASDRGCRLTHHINVSGKFIVDDSGKRVR
jgi:hypothetical protein